MHLDLIATATAWIYAGVATWYGAAMVGGVLILIAERFDRRREPSDADVRHAASRYRQHYGETAFHVIGDHVLAAGFAPDGKHRRFLKRVSCELLATAVTEDRARAIVSQMRFERGPHCRAKICRECLEVLDGFGGEDDLAGASNGRIALPPSRRWRGSGSAASA